MMHFVWLLAPLLFLACDQVGPEATTDPSAQVGVPFSEGERAPDEAGVPDEADDQDEAVAEDPYDDPDDDGLGNGVEAGYGTDPLNPDSDGGGVSDGDEVYTFGSNPLDASDDVAASTDSDGDGLDDLREGLYGSDPNVADTDGGGVDDYQELFVDGTNPRDPSDDGYSSWGDDDADGLSNSEELSFGTDPEVVDSDGGGASDYDEVYLYGSDPLDGEDDAAAATDTDGDGLSDFWETDYFGTDPDTADTDGGGFSDYDELSSGTDPNDARDDGAAATDSDGDGLYDFWETEYYGTDPNAADTDGGGANDYDELSWGYNPNDASDDANVAQGGGDDTDSDGDGLWDSQEPAFGTDPALADTDGGGISDGDEVYQWGSNPLDGSDDLSASRDSDGDSLADLWETDYYGTDPNAADSDGGGVDDYNELVSGTDPNDARDDGGTAVDSDGDGLYDFWETTYYGTDPAAADSDGDGVSDYDELVNGTDPSAPSDQGSASWSDDDADGLSNSEELSFGTDPEVADSDGGGASDYDEIYFYGSDPLDGEDDAAAASDTDGDGLSDLWETDYFGTDPEATDTDGGGVSDYDELSSGTDPRDSGDDGAAAADSDGDGLYDFWETEYYGTDPNAADTDGGGANDYDELSWGYNPNDASDDVNVGQGAGH